MERRKQETLLMACLPSPSDARPNSDKKTQTQFITLGCEPFIFVTGASVLINCRTISRIKSMCSLLSLASIAAPRPPPLPFASLSLCQTGQILETCIIGSFQDAGGKVDLQRPIESTYPSSLSNPQPAAPADRSPMAYLH